MLKGVNKQVLEISETENSFFEKAIFFVKPEYSGMSEGRLRESARKEIDGIGKPPLSRGKNTEKLKVAISLCATFIAGLISGIVFLSCF